MIGRYSGNALRHPDLVGDAPPYRPIPLIVPLILLENRTWETEMERFFEGEGAVFMPVLNLHGEKLRWLRVDAETRGRELELGKPVLDLDRIQRHRVVITNYETIMNYQHSFACLHRGAPLWSAIVTDEAQEFKTPNTKVSHAVKALKAKFQIASTGTPVENRLLDLWNLFDAIQPGLLRSAQEFRKGYEEPVESDEDSDKLAKLKHKLLFQQPHAFLLRRNKDQIATLPRKTILKVTCEMSDAEIDLHRQLIRSIKGRSAGTRQLAVLHDFSRLYQRPYLLRSEAEDASAAEVVANSSKLRAVLEVLHSIRQRREKAIIFTRHRTMQSLLAKVPQTAFGRYWRGPVRRVGRRGTSFPSRHHGPETIDQSRAAEGR